MSWSLMGGAPEGSGRRLPGTKLMVTHNVDVDEEAVPPRVQDQGSLQLLHCEPISLQAEGTISWGAGQHGSIQAISWTQQPQGHAWDGSFRSWSGAASRRVKVTGLPSMH